MKYDLSELCTIKVGYQSRTKIVEVPDGTHRIIQGRDFSSIDHLNYISLALIKPERKPEPYTVTQNDILFQARGINHFAYCIEDDFNNTLAGNSFYIINPNVELVLPQYLAWFLNQQSILKYLQSEAGGSIISFISKRTLSRLKVEIPPLNVQKKIGAVQTLLKREAQLKTEISILKSNLIYAVCLNAVYEPGDINE